VLETAIPPLYLQISAHPVSPPLDPFNSTNITLAIEAHSNTLFLYSSPLTLFRGVTTPYLQSFLTFSSLALASTLPNLSTQLRHSNTSCSSSLIGYPTVPKHLPPLVPTATHSPNYMFPAFSLDCMVIKEEIDYSETSVIKYQQRRTTSRKSEGFNISDIYKL